MRTTLFIFLISSLACFAQNTWTNSGGPNTFKAGGGPNTFSINLASSGGGSASPSLVQVVNTNIDAATQGLTNGAITVTAGNSIVECVAWADNATLTVSDTLGNTFKTVSTKFLDSVNSQYIALLIATNIVGGTDRVTNLFTGASVSFVRCIVTEWSGVMTANVADLSGYTNSTATTVTVTNITPGFSYETLLGFGMQDGAATPDPTTGSGFTSPAGSLCDTGNSALLFEYYKMGNSTTKTAVPFGITGGGLVGAAVSIRSQ